VEGTDRDLSPEPGAQVRILPGARNSLTRSFRSFIVSVGLDPGAMAMGTKPAHCSPETREAHDSPSPLTTSSAKEVVAFVKYETCHSVFNEDECPSQVLLSFFDVLVDEAPEPGASLWLQVKEGV